MALDFRNMKKLTIGGIELKKLLINGIEVWRSFTNQISESITSSKTQFVGDNGEDGYRTGYYVDSGGTETAKSGIDITGFIPVQQGDVIYFKNIKASITSGVVSRQDYTILVLYDSTFTKIGSGWLKFSNYKSSHAYLVDNFTAYENGYISSFTIIDKYNNFTKNGGGYIRVSAEGIDSTSIITVNEPI